METKKKKREWVKTAAIIFLSVLLVLTFFSNTIMNHSLPEVAAQYVESGSINAKIRGSGAVTANEAYEVMLAQTRKIESVLVRVGDEVTAGDPLFKLESMESEELKQAQQQLKDMQIAYQEKLINQGNDGSTEDREVQKLREAYNEAIRVYMMYSNMNPDDVRIAKIEAEQYLAGFDERIEITTGRLEDTKAELEAVQAELENSTNRKEAEALNATISESETIIANVNDAANTLQTLVTKNNSELKEQYEAYEALLRGDKINSTTEYILRDMDRFADNPYDLMERLGINFRNDEDQEEREMVYGMIDAYTEVNKVMAEVRGVITHPDDVFHGDNKTVFTAKYESLTNGFSATKEAAEIAMQEAKDRLDEMEREGLLDYENLNKKIAILTEDIADYTEQLSDLKDEQRDAADEVEKLGKAEAAASEVKNAEDALEDKLFEINKGDASYLHLQADQEAIEAKKLEIEELTKEADGQEVLAKVSGVISSINVTAGGTGTPDAPIATITVADRGYMLKIPVTLEQARQVKIGDTAEVTNYYWGNITATLENIAGDPSSGGKGKLLIFRITGDEIEAGTNLTLSIGQKSANYDCLIPNSAIRSDSNGSFVLVVVAKSSPLGNRYRATRADVQVLAADDTKSAVTGLAYGDFVITTSTKPLEAGQLVRLVDNG